MNRFLERITCQPILRRLKEAFQEQPDVQVMRYILGFLERITCEPILHRLRVLCQEQPEIQVTHYILNHPRILEWVHTIGVTKDEELGSLVPPFPPPELRKQAAAEELEVFLWTGLIDLGKIMALYEIRRSSNAPDCPAVLDSRCRRPAHHRHLPDRIRFDRDRRRRCPG